MGLSPKLLCAVLLFGSHTVSVRALWNGSHVCRLSICLSICLYVCPASDLET